MYRALAILLLAAACGPPPNTPVVSKEPVSVRGWIADVAGAPQAQLRTAETDSVRRLQLFQSTNVWVDDAPYVSGGVAENGSFLLLDVPPGNITITFTAPGAPASRLMLKNIPGNADVFLPAILLKPDSVELLEPSKVTVRLAARLKEAAPAGLTAQVGGINVPVMKTPMAAMVDRHDYPNPPNSPVPLATVK